MTEIKMHQYALLEDTRDPSNTKYIYGPTLFRLGNFSSLFSFSFYVSISDRMSQRTHTRHWEE